MFKNLIRSLGLLVVSIASTAHAQQISLEDILKAQTNEKLSQLKQALDQASAEKSSGAGRIFGATEAEFEQTQLDKEQVMFFGISQPLSLHFSPKDNDIAHAAQSDSIYYAEKSSFREHNSVLGLAYVDLLFYQRLANTLKNIAETSGQLFSGVKSGSLSGATEGITFIKAKLVYQRLESRLKSYSDNFATLATSLNDIAKVKIAADFSQALLMPIDFSEGPTTNDLASTDGILSLSKQKDSLLARANAVKARQDFSFGIGLEQNTNVKENAYVFKFAYPLGQNFINRQEAREYRADAEVVDRQMDIALNSLQDRVRFLRAELLSKNESLKAADALSASVDDMYKAVLRGRSNGLASYAELVEVIEQKMEIEEERCQINKDADQLRLQLKLLTEVSHD